MRSLKRTVNIILCLLLVLSLVACGSRENESGTGGDRDEGGAKIRLGMTFDTFVMERWQRDRDIFVSTARALGAEVNVQNANGDVNEQINQINYFIDQGVDVIIVVATDGSALKDIVAKARSKGIKIISYDRLILNADTDLYISFDNGMVGKYMADKIIEEMPGGGSIIKIKGPEKDYNVRLVEEGFNEEIAGHGIRVLDEYSATEWKGEEASDYLAQIDDKLEQVQAIMCGNDALAAGAIRYLSERRLASKITVTGQDADLDACQRIVEGTQAMTVYKPIEVLAKRAAQCAVTLAEGGKVNGVGDGQFTMINDGTYDIPYVSIQPIMVTRENIDKEIIDSGFHLREDVYFNVREDEPDEDLK